MDEKKIAALEGQVQELQRRVKTQEKILFVITITVLIWAAVCFWQFWRIARIIDAVIVFRDGVINFHGEIIWTLRKLIALLDVLQ